MSETTRKISMQQSKRRKKFNKACERLKELIDSENPQFPRDAIGTVFLMQSFDPERAQGILKEVYRIYQQSITEIEDIRHHSSKWGAPMVAAGDSEGKVTYTYPTGNSEDY